MRKMADEMRDLGRKQAELMRGKAQERALKRKEEYLGARVPRELKEKVIAHANRLGIPVSILIRNILEDAFSGHDAPDSATAADDKKNAAHSRGEQRFPAVIGWEEMTLNRTMHCSACHAELEAGMLVTLGLPIPGEDHVILCAKCK